MANKYGVVLDRTTDTTLFVGFLDPDTTTPKRFELASYVLGQSGGAADNQFLWRILRASGGTPAGASPSIELDDLADAAALTDALDALTTNPTTLNASWRDIPLHQRATFAWTAAPGDTLVMPATANNGVGFQTPTAPVSLTTTASVKFQE